LDFSCFFALKNGIIITEYTDGKEVYRVTELEKQLMKNNDALLTQIEAQADELRLLREQVDYLTKKLFGRSSEKSVDLEGQLDLFKDDESFKTAETTEEKTIVEEIQYKRKKRVGYKATLTKHLPIKEIHCELNGADCVCDWCNSELRHIGKSYVHEEVVFVPATMYKKVYYQHAYECPTCKSDGEDVIKKAWVPKQPITHSLASPSVLAQLLHQKIELSLPFYRQEKEWLNYGLRVPRRTLANWFITSTEKWLKPIWQKLKEHLLAEELLHADETYYKVLSSDKQKTYYWLFRTIEQAKHPIILFQHDLTRKSSVPQLFLKGFEGFLHCDAYSAYGTLESITVVNCWAHMRRKFIEAKGTNIKSSKADQGVAFCDALFTVEREIQLLSPEEKYRIRNVKSKSILNQFWQWISSFPVLEGSKLGKAIGYVINNRSGLMNFLRDGRCTISNNLAERSIRPTTVGRKNWNFSTSTRGAIANGIVYSLVETAKENGINPTKYFEFLFEHLPNLSDLSNLEAYLPWANQVQHTCK
jgi:transposase